MPQPRNVGFVHVPSDVTDIDSVVESAAEFDVLPIGDITTVDQGLNKGGKAVYLHDPDGITVELIQQS
jgi:catechol 2,3-dioxygenase-like lactoylglutathione lyase family enzyme